MTQRRRRRLNAFTTLRDEIATKYDSYVENADYVSLTEAEFKAKATKIIEDCDNSERYGETLDEYLAYKEGLGEDTTALKQKIKGLKDKVWHKEAWAGGVCMGMSITGLATSVVMLVAGLARNLAKAENIGLFIGGLIGIFVFTYLTCIS